LHRPGPPHHHQHHHHHPARVLVVDGEVDVNMSNGNSTGASAGHLFEFEPGERRTIVARSDARLLMVLSPWPGDGHPGALSLEEKSQAREKAAEHAQ
jgi:quercetin dioxygenase-like cupin family protein